MQPIGTAYCAHCRRFVEALVGVGVPAVIAVTCSECGSLLAASHPEHDVSHADLPAFARMHIIPNLPYDDAREAFLAASFQ